jgi:hypothetical protein
MNWYKLAKRKFSTYSPELGSLKYILEQGWSPHDYADKVIDFLKKYSNEPRLDVDFDECEYDPWEYGDEWIENVATPESLEKFKNFTQYVYDDFPTMDMPYNYMDLNKFMKPMWQVHFTDYPFDIAEQGFVKGHPEVEGVHLTTYYKDRGRGPGFNFGYLADYRLPNQSQYGKHAVVFYGGGLDIHHYGDMENQTIFWGPFIDPRMIFPLYYDGYEWNVIAENGREIFQSEDIDSAVNYVISNWRMLDDIKTKEKRNRKNIRRLY